MLKIILGITILNLVIVVICVDRGNFKTCEQSSFCKYGFFIFFIVHRKSVTKIEI